MKIKTGRSAMKQPELTDAVPTTGLEPACPCEHHPLKMACLPISPRGHHVKEKNPPKKGEFFGDPAGIRTQDPYIKSVLLYQLSYGILPFFKSVCKYRNFKLSYKYTEKKVRTEGRELIQN
jgi:hypothetical protein